MGSGRWTDKAWSAYRSAHVDGKATHQIYTSSAMNGAYDPSALTIRESRDSDDNPASTAIILALDVTGSMGILAETIMRKGLHTVATEIYARKPVTDPHIMVAAVGDMKCDSAPLQVTQFEADIRIAEQTKGLYLEGGGGGNDGESYSGAHLFAGMRTSIDCFDKRGRKGYLFTIGDEPIHDDVTKFEAKRFLNLDLERDMTAAECLSVASRMYEVFHIVVQEGYAGSHDSVLRTWKPLLPERTMLMSDHTKLAEIVVSAIQVTEGASTHDVASSWSGDTSLVVADAIRNLPAAGRGGVQRLGA